MLHYMPSTYLLYYILYVYNYNKSNYQSYIKRHLDYGDINFGQALIIPW